MTSSVLSVIWMFGHHLADDVRAVGGGEHGRVGLHPGLALLQGQSAAGAGDGDAAGRAGQRQPAVDGLGDRVGLQERDLTGLGLAGDQGAHRTLTP
jgi:hypothetical protein